MPAFKKLGPGDQIDNVLVLEPQWTLASGSSGWKGSPEGSASIDLYGGANRQRGGVVTEYQYQPIIPASHTFGDMRRPNPITASIDYVWMTNEDLTLTQRTRTRWGREHWKTVDRLYQDYHTRDVDYTTSSYDHYCLFFNSGSSNIVSIYDQLDFSGNTYIGVPTGSFTLEAWFKPMASGSAFNDLTIVSKRGVYKLFLNGGASGKLTWCLFSGSTSTYVTSSLPMTIGQWHHAAVTFDSTTMSGTLYQDLAEAGTFVYTAPQMKRAVNFTGSFHIGAEWGGTITQQGTTFKKFFEDPTILAAGNANTVFHGFIGNVRLWGTKRTTAQLSGTYNVRLTGSALAQPLLMDIRLSEGPLSDASPPTDVSTTLTRYQYAGRGSGTMNWAAAYQGVTPDFGGLYSFNRSGPVWYPNDNTNFYVPKQPAVTFVSGTGWTGSSSSVQRMRVFHIPSAFYGRNIVPNSVRITDRTWNEPRLGLVRTLLDDGRGGLFLSGSSVSSSIDPTTGIESAQQFRGVEWNKVGNVFYEQGLIVIRDPALLDFGEPTDAFTTSPNDLLQLEFKGQSRIPVKTVIARIDRGELNCSLNPTYYSVDDHDAYRTVRHPSGNLYVTTVGLYNSDHELVGVARLAEPLRVRPRDRFAVKIRMDF